ncbi:hypothetical protein KEM48_002433 [Puccinia striiformis f. sp. tritici PST-130]|nr:hypothetical protein KEM48_002433 [Puccinia striiformis f. sp. tritici PST-130]
MPPRKKKNSTATPAALETPTITPTSTAASKKKKPIPWDKDAVEPGFSSMQILLDWIQEPGNWRSWRGKKGAGVSKEVLANQILEELAGKGIHHRVPRDIRTKIQELQTSFTSACDWLCNTGQGILAKDVANGTNNIRDGLLKRCKYYYDLEVVMGERANANPRDTVDSRSDLVPNLLDQDESDPHEEGLPDRLLTSLTADELALDRSDNDDPPEPSRVNNTSSPAPDSAAANAGSKSKGNSKKRALPQGLEKAISNSYEYRYKQLTFKENQEKDRLASEERREKKRLELEKRRVRIEESDGKARRATAEAEQARLQVAMMKDLKDTGFSDEHIKSFLDR